MVEGLRSFLILLKDFILGIVEGLWTLVNSLKFVFEISTDITWMPAFMYSVMTLCLVIIIVLRVVGR